MRSPRHQGTGGRSINAPRRVPSRDSVPVPYPSQIAVFCDHCGTVTEHDYVVHDQMTREERLGVARTHLADNEGWSCTPEGDFCPACKLGDEAS